MREAVLVTPRSFGKNDPAPIQLLESAGYVVVRNPYQSIMTKQQMIEQVGNAVGIVSGLDPLDADVIAAAPKLRAISKYGTGVDNVDFEALKARNIAFATAAGANANAVADYTFALMLACARKLPLIDRSCHDRDWTKRTALDVFGKRLGILGLGAIGKGVARRAQGFDMGVLAYDIFKDDAYASAHGIRYAEPDEIYQSCDFITLHMPLTDETRHMIGAPQLSLMKPTAVLVNTARGGLVCEDALVQALQEGKLYAAGFDAFEQEPPVGEALYSLDNLIMGSHCAASTAGATLEMGMTSARHLIEMLKNS
ncbi:MAG: phosphoglycerate dehydrogenase [Oscillospiraceae bacterium]|nr:phosphoglycerate dehydrogenase [Oscillospiraceae bacterium]